MKNFRVLFVGILLFAVIWFIGMFILIDDSFADSIGKSNSSVVEEQIDTSSDEQKVVISPELEKDFQESFVNGYRLFKEMKEDIEEIESGCQKKNKLLMRMLYNVRKYYNQNAWHYNKMAEDFPWHLFEGRKDMPPKVIELLPQENF